MILQLDKTSLASVAHALVRAASALVPTPGRLFSVPQFSPKTGVEKSLDTARTSACATVLNDFSATRH